MVFSIWPLRNAGQSSSGTASWSAEAYDLERPGTPVGRPGHGTSITVDGGLTLMAAHGHDLQVGSCEARPAGGWVDEARLPAWLRDEAPGDQLRKWAGASRAMLCLVLGDLRRKHG